MSLNAAPSPLLAEAASRSGPTTEASMVAEEAAARALDFEPAARHRGVVVVVIAAVVVATAAVVVVVAVTEELFLIFSATEDSEFPRIATFLISS